MLSPASASAFTPLILTLELRVWFILCIFVYLAPHLLLPVNRLFILYSLGDTPTAVQRQQLTLNLHSGPSAPDPHQTELTETERRNHAFDGKFISKVLF